MGVLSRNQRMTQHQVTQQVSMKQQVCVLLQPSTGFSSNLIFTEKIRWAFQCELIAYISHIWQNSDFFSNRLWEEVNPDSLKQEMCTAMRRESQEGTDG